MPEYGESEDRARKMISSAFGVKPKTEEMQAGSGNDSNLDVVRDAMKRRMDRIKESSSQAAAGE